jgi:hypothetical protein
VFSDVIFTREVNDWEKKLGIDFLVAGLKCRPKKKKNNGDLAQ